jgi:hypothetical protein
MRAAPTASHIGLQCGQSDWPVVVSLLSVSTRDWHCLTSLWCSMVSRILFLGKEELDGESLGSTRRFLGPKGASKEKTR